MNKELVHAPTLCGLWYVAGGGAEEVSAMYSARIIRAFSDARSSRVSETCPQVATSSGNVVLEKSSAKLDTTACSLEAPTASSIVSRVTNSFLY